MKERATKVRLIRTCAKEGKVVPRKVQRAQKAWRRGYCCKVSASQVDSRETALESF